MLGRDELQEPQAHRDQRRLVTHSTISHNKRGACCTQVHGGAAVVMSGRRAVAVKDLMDALPYPTGARRRCKACT